MTISRNAVILLAAWVTTGGALAFMAQPPAAMTFAFVFLGWIVGLTAHEFGHAFVAWQAGDHTVADKGYLSLDPLRYADPLTSIALPALILVIGGIAFPGGAVYLRPDLMRGPAWRAAASLAGPAGTLVVLLALALLLALGDAMAATSALWPALAVLALFQAMALILNLLPVPGLDGYGALRSFLPEGLERRLRPIEPLAMFGLLALLIFVPGVFDAIFRGAVTIVRGLGVRGDLMLEGWNAFRFWD